MSIISLTILEYISLMYYSDYSMYWDYWVRMVFRDLGSVRKVMEGEGGEGRVRRWEWRERREWWVVCRRERSRGSLGSGMSSCRVDTRLGRQDSFSWMEEGSSRQERLG